MSGTSNSGRKKGYNWCINDRPADTLSLKEFAEAIKTTPQRVGYMVKTKLIPDAYVKRWGNTGRYIYFQHLEQFSKYMVKNVLDKYEIESFIKYIKSYVNNKPVLKPTPELIHERMVGLQELNKLFV